eukprot:98073_1
MRINIIDLLAYLEAHKHADEEAFYDDESSEFNSSLSVSNEYVYHYTSKNKARKIINSCALLPSRNEYNDCLFGIGIYFTSLNPSNSKRDILFNNYGSETSYNESNANAWIRIKQNNLNVSEINCNRNVWIYPTSQPLDLSSVDAEVSCLKCNFGNITSSCNQCDGDGCGMFNCKQCDGSGIYQYYKQCWTCNGNGNGNGVSLNHEYDHETGINLITVEPSECPSCNGTGNFFWNREEECNNCSGTGGIMEKCNACNGAGNVDCPECDGADVICL